MTDLALIQESLQGLRERLLWHESLRLDCYDNNTRFAQQWEGLLEQCRAEEARRDQQLQQLLHDAVPESESCYKYDTELRAYLATDIEAYQQLLTAAECKRPAIVAQGHAAPQEFLAYHCFLLAAAILDRRIGLAARRVEWREGLRRKQGSTATQGPVPAWSALTALFLEEERLATHHLSEFPAPAHAAAARFFEEQRAWQKRFDAPVQLHLIQRLKWCKQLFEYQRTTYQRWAGQQSVEHSQQLWEALEQTRAELARRGLAPLPAMPPHRHAPAPAPAPPGLWAEHRIALLLGALLAGLLFYACGPVPFS